MLTMRQSNSPGKLMIKGSVDLLTKILKMEEGHVDWAEIQQAQIEQMGMENYLVNQTEGPVS